MAKQPLIWHWRQDDDVKNFGDYLADFLIRELFLPIRTHEGPVHIIGSVIADFLVPEGGGQQGEKVPKVVFWGCGARDENGLSDDRFENARILGVRGPLTASVLKIGAGVPQGDAAFLLPALYKPEASPSTAGKSVCIPHFWDRRPDEELRAASGCDVLLRTNISGGMHDLRYLIDAIAAADFVLAASLHGAIVAAAYGVPFAFWDNGHVDLPFKWKDLAAFLSIPATFYGSLPEARAGYKKEIGPKLIIPSLWPLLAVAPFPLRPDALVRLLDHELASTPADRREGRLEECLRAFVRRAEDTERQAAEVTDTIDLLKATVQNVEGDRARAVAVQQELQQRIDDLGGAQQELQQRFDDLGGAHQQRGAVIEERDRALAAALGELDEVRKAQASLLRERDEAAEAAKAQLSLLESQRESLIAEHDLDRRRLAERLSEFASQALRLPNDVSDAGLGAVQHEDDAFGAALAQLGSAIGDLHRRNLEAETANSRLAMELVQLGEAFAGASSEAERLRSEIDDLRRRLDQQVEDAELRSSKLMTELAEVSDAQVNASSEAERLRGEVDDLRQRLDQQLQDAQAHSRRASDEIARLQGQLGEEQAQRQGAEATLQEREQHLRVSFEEIAELSRRGDAAQREISRLAHANAEVESNLRSAAEAYRGIATSTTWLMARKITRVFARLSPDQRRGLRHALHRVVRLTRRLRGLDSQGPAPTAAVAQASFAGPAPAPAPVPAPAATRPPLHGDPNREAVVVYFYSREEHGSKLDAFLRSTSADVVVVVDAKAAEVLYGTETFESLFELHPMAAAACGTLVDHADSIASSGAVVAEGILTSAGSGESRKAFRYASVRPVEALWPEFVAINVDAYLHVGGLQTERGLHEALVEFGISVQERGLEVVVNPFAVALQTRAMESLRLPADLIARNDGLVRKARPKVLFTDAVTPTPDRDSGSQDIYWFMRIFQNMGYEVTFLPAQNLDHAGRYTDDLRMLGIFCPLAPEVEAGWMFLRDHGPSFQLMMMYRVSSACHLVDPARQFAPNAKIVFDTVDLHFLREERAAEHSGSEEMFRAAQMTKAEEIRLMNVSDATILLSSVEYDQVGELAPSVNRHLIPIVRPIPGRSSPAEGREDVMFVGGFKHLPNVDAVQYLCNDIWPKVRERRQDIRLLIIGADAPEEIQALHDPENGVEFVGFVDDLSPYYERVRINLAPLRYGAGVKGKVVASLSAGLPTVASPTAVEGMPVVEGHDVLVGRDAEEFAAAIVRLYADPDLWLKLSDNGVKAASDAFSITAVRARLETMLDSIGLGYM